MATAYEIQVTEAYIGLLGRAPDPAGLEYWVGKLDAAVTAGQDAKLALKKLTNDIALSPEWIGGLGTNDASTTAGANAVVEGMYQQLFERAATTADLAYWTPQLTGGSTTAAEMALNLITAAKGNTAKPTDGEVLGYKQQAATYYVESVPQANYSSSSANNAVKDVNGPSNLLDSKTATDFVTSGVGVTTDLANIGAGNDVTMTATADVVTGTVGTGATYSTQNILDVTVGDNDSVTLTGDAGFTLDDVTNVENLNINLADSLGAGFTIDATKALASTIKIDVANTVTQGGVELTGDTTVSVTGVSTSNVSTTDVTSLTVGVGGGASAITADNDAATVQINDIDANDTTVTLSATTVDLDLDGTTGTNDTVSVSAVGAVSLDASDTALVEKISLSGNGAAATFTVTGVTATTNMVYGVTGDQNVTLAGTGAMFTTADFSDTSTAGTTALSLSSSGAAAVDVSTWGVLSGGVELTGAYDAGTETLMVASGSTVKISADQAQTINFDTNDGTTSSSLTLDIDNDTAAITTTDIDTLTVQTGDMALIIGGALTGSDNDATVNIGGTNDVTISGALSGGDITWTALDATIGAGGIDADGDLTINATNDISVTGAITVDNDVAMTGNDINIVNGLTTEDSSATDGNVNLTASGTGDVDTAGLLNIDGSLTVSSSDQFTTAGVLNAENDITITADDYVATTTVDTQSGNLSITATNDVDLNGAVGVDGTLTISQTATGGSVNFTGGSLNVDNDSTITGQNVTMVNFVTNAGDLTLTAQNDINLDGTVDVSGDFTALTKEASGGDFDAVTGGAQAIVVDNDISITSADRILVDAITTVDGNVTLSAANEVTQSAGGASDVDGTLTISSTGSTNVGTVTIAGNINAENDVTLSASHQVDINGAITSQFGPVAISGANDITVDGAITVTSGSYTASTKSGASGLEYLTADDATGAISVSNDVTITADKVTVGNITSTASGNVTITAANDVDIAGDIVNTTTQGNISITAAEAWAAGIDAIIIDATENLSAQNDITITASGGGTAVFNDSDLLADSGNITLTAGGFTGTGLITATAGNIQINSTNDSETTNLDGAITADAGKVEFLGGKYDVEDVDADAGGVTIAGDSTGDFGNVQSTGSSVRITATNNATAVTGDVSFSTGIDSPTVLAQGAGDYALGTVMSTSGAVVSITSAGGNDSMTLSTNAGGGADVYTVSTGDGADVVTNTATTGASAINTGGGDDTYNMTANSVATVDMGAGTGDKVVTGGAIDASANGAITNYEILQLGGNITMSEAQIDNDSTFEIQGGNHVITASVTSVNLSNVDFQAGNTSSFALNGTAAADTIVGSDGVDVITGGNGIDTLTGGGGADSFIVTTTIAAGNRDTVGDFVAGTDKLTLSAGKTTLATGVGIAPVDTTDTTAAADGNNGAYGMTGVTTANADLIILQNGATLGSRGDLDAATDGTELLKALSNTVNPYSHITAVASNTTYFLAYQGGNAYLYHLTNDGNTSAVAAEFTLVMTLTGVAADALGDAAGSLNVLIA
jgi:hypothetical protein